HHERYDVADMPHLFLRQDWIGGTGEGIDLEIEQARQVAEILDVFGRQDEGNAGKAAGSVRIDGESGMRMRRAQHQRVQRWRGRRNVVGIPALASNERIVLLAQDALTNTEFDRSSHSISTL